MAESLPMPAVPEFVAGLIGFYLALHASFAAEFIVYLVGVNIPIVMLLAVTLPVIWVAVSPRPLRFMETNIAMPYLFMLVWWGLAALFMSYKGYWIGLFEYGIRFHAVPLLLCGLLVSLRQVRTAVVGYTWGFVAALFLCWRYGAIDSAGRFKIAGTSLGNPNDLALNLLYGIAFMTVLLVDTSTIKRVACLLAVFVSLYYVLKTGSRSNFLAISVMMLACWTIAPGRIRRLMVVGGLAAGLMFMPLIPRETWLRLTTFQTASADEVAQNEELGHAVGSTEARKNLQIRAIVITLKNPIFGVGPNMFAYALDERMKVEGFRKGTWQRPHNTYLDISSETGIVGLLLYVSCIIWCIRTNYRAVRATQQRAELRPALGQSCSLFLATVVFSFVTLFTSITYVGQVPFLLGLTAANWLALRDAGAFTPRMRAAPQTRFTRFRRSRTSVAPAVAE